MRKHSPPSKLAINALALSSGDVGAIGGGRFAPGVGAVASAPGVSTRATVCCASGGGRSRRRRLLFGRGRDRRLGCRRRRGRGDGLRLGDGSWRRRRFVADHKSRGHLRCPVMAVGRDDADRGGGCLLGNAFDRAFAAAEIAEGQAVRQTGRSQPQPLAAGIDEGRQLRLVTRPHGGGRQVDACLRGPRWRRIS